AQQPSSSVRPATPLAPPAHFPQILSSSPLSPHCSSSGASDTISVCISDPDHDSDKMSVLSEADSGVVCSRTSRPSSMVGPPIPRIPSILTPSTSGVIIACGVCQKPSYYSDEVAISNAPTNMAIQNVISRYFAQHPQLAPKDPKPTSDEVKKEPNCQLCEENIKPATVYCEQCDIFYCQPCQVALHPARGPLAKHTLLCEENIKPATVYCEQCDIFYCQPCQVALHPARGPLAKHTLVSAAQRWVILFSRGQNISTLF
ncbi:unnamed protein product, partial [Cylicostephanus goldi]